MDGRKIQPKKNKFLWSGSESVGWFTLHLGDTLDLTMIQNIYPSVFVPPATCTWKCRFGAARRFGNIDMTFHELKLRWAKWMTSDLTTNITTCASYQHQPSAILPCQQPLPGVQCWSSPRKGLKDPHVLHHRCFSKHPLRWDLQAPWKMGSKIAKASGVFPSFPPGGQWLGAGGVPTNWN